MLGHAAPHDVRVEAPAPEEDAGATDEQVRELAQEPRAVDQRCGREAAALLPTRRTDLDRAGRPEQ